MSVKNNCVELVFPKLGHFWLDAGLVGLLKSLDELKEIPISYKIIENNLVLKGTPEEVEKALEAAYVSMVDSYYNVSTQKQKAETASYNFYYDSKEDQFVSFPKRKAVGIADLIYNKAARPTGSSIKWVSEMQKDITFNGKVTKRNRGVLPKEYAHLQEKMELFLDEQGINVTTAGLLVDGPNAVMPKVKIKVEQKRTKGHCYLCGEEAEVLEDANQTVFPLLTGGSGVLSFNSEAGNPGKVCWKCALLGKFVPVTAFYSMQGEHLYGFLPYSISLTKMAEVYDLLQDAKFLDPNLYSNFKHSLGGYFYHPFEMTFAFLFAQYSRMLKQKLIDETEEGVFELDFENLYKLTLEKAPLELYVVHSKSEGSTNATKMMWPFKETVYFFRMMETLEHGTGTPMKQIMSLLLDYSETKNEAKSLLRNRVCEQILKKQSILPLIEQHVFHTELQYFKPLLDLVLLYEWVIKGEDAMFKEEQDAAVNLGRRIGMAVGENTTGKKGDLFALRKSRRKVDFLEQLNRLQFKLGNDFVVPADVYEGKLTDENYQEFKQFCMVAALNSYNYAKNNKNHGKREA